MVLAPTSIAAPGAPKAPDAPVGGQAATLGSMSAQIRGPIVASKTVHPTVPLAVVVVIAPPAVNVPTWPQPVMSSRASSGGAMTSITIAKLGNVKS